MSSEIQKIKNKIEKLDKNESVEIFKIIHKNQINYSQNNNGIFIDLSCLNEQSLIEINAFLDFIEENKKHIYEIETKIKQNKITLDNKFCDNRSNQQKHQSNKYEIILCNDYSPFITEIDDNYIEDIILLENTNNDIIMIETNTEDDLNDIIDNELEDIEEIDEEDTLSISHINKKKKNQGLQSRILKKCKNINAINGDIDEYEKDYNDEQELKELPLENEYL
jgi:hypothetical protein